MTTKRRLSGEARKAGIIDAAEALILEQRLPLNMEVLASRLGVSKALIYAHFPSQTALLNAILERRLEQLPPDPNTLPSLKEAALRQAEAYFEHVSQHGPIIQILLRDPALSRALSPAVRRLRDAAARTWIRRARRELALPLREASGAFNMIMAIPEEAGNLVFLRQLDPALAREMCREFVDNSLDVVSPA